MNTYRELGTGETPPASRVLARQSRAAAQFHNLNNNAHIRAADPVATYLQLLQGRYGI